MVEQVLLGERALDEVAARSASEKRARARDAMRARYLLSDEMFESMDLALTCRIFSMFCARRARPCRGGAQARAHVIGRARGEEARGSETWAVSTLSSAARAAL